MSKHKSLLEKIRFKYRVSILNENTLEEAWHARLSRFSVFVWTCVFFLITFTILTLLIFFTPIKRYLPGFEDASVREVVMNELMRVDSLQNALDVQNEYITVMRSLLSGDIQADTITSIDSLTLIQRERILLEKSQTEKDFCTKMEEKDLFNLTQSPTTTSQYVFFRPVRGVISTSFDPLNNQFGIILATAPNEIVVSVLPGTVISTEFTLENGWVITVQHENDYLSVYKDNSRLLKAKGESVRAGEAIAQVGESDEPSGVRFEFELWKKGIPVNPEEVIAY